MQKQIIGIGVLLKTPQNTYLFQERDMNTTRYPGMIAPFGGGVDAGEALVGCAVREMKEELELTITQHELQEIGAFESHTNKGVYIQMYLVENIVPTKLVLREGKSIKEFSLEEALEHPKVTDFTKEILRSI